MPHSFTNLWYHLVWSTKNREPFIEKKWKYALYDQMRHYCQFKGYHLDFVNGVSDHVHLLISLKPTFTVSSVVQNIKVDSYYWVQKQGLVGPHFGWQDGYGGFTVSPTQVNRVRRYIERQEIRHRDMSYEEELEFLALALPKDLSF